MILPPRKRLAPSLSRLMVGAVMAALSLAAAAEAAPRKTAEKPPTVETPAPPEQSVVFDGKPLLTIRANSLSFSPTDRANVISERLGRLVRSNPNGVAAIRTVEGENSTDIVTGDLTLMAVSDTDALKEGISRQTLAEAHANRIREALGSYLEERSSRNLMLKGLYSILATVALFLVLLFIRRLYPRLTTRIESWRGTVIRSIHFQSVEILHEGRIVAGIITLLGWLKILLVVILLNLYLTLVLGFFPWTRGVSARLADYLLIPLARVWHAILAYLPNIFFIVVIAFFSHLFIRLLRFAFGEVEKGTVTIPGFFRDWAEPSFKISRFMVIAFAMVVAFPYLPGSDSPAFKGVSVFLGVLFSLGSSSAVANVVAGIILTYMRAFKLGDRVKIADTTGDVIEKTLLVTRISTIKNVEITIPNAMVLSSHITNYSASAHEYGLILHTTVTIGYDVPWRRVHELLVAAAQGTENILSLPGPFVLQTSLDDFYVSYELNAYTDKPSVMARTYSELHQNIQDRFNEAGVEIMSPHFAQLRDGNISTIPGQYLPPGYRPGGLRVEMTPGTRSPSTQNPE